MPSLTTDCVTALIAALGSVPHPLLITPPGLTGWQAMVIAVLTSGLVSSAIVFTARTWIGERIKAGINHKYAGELERLKSALESEAKIELAQLGARLQMAAAEQQARSGSLIQRRFDAIAAVHGDLLKFYEAVQQMVQPNLFGHGPSREQASEATYKTNMAFEKSYMAQKIFFPKALADRIDGIRKALVSNANVFQYLVAGQSNANPAMSNERWMDVYQKLNQEVPVAITALEDELRALMGDNPTEATSGRPGN
jgi:hypothetical protein